MHRLLVLSSLLGCAPDVMGTDSAAVDAGQPGINDPTARQWTRAGEWYSADPLELDTEVLQLLADADADANGRPVRALLTPHAGLRYSGSMAAQAWARASVPRTIIILGPNHWDEGVPAGIWTEGPWLIPGHALPVHDPLTQRLMELEPQLKSDRDAFNHHEVEMNLPFIQFLRPDARLVIMGWRDNQDWDFRDFGLEEIEAAGQAVATLIQEREADGDEVLLVITTDLVHYVPLAQANEEDPILLDLIEHLDVEGLYDAVIDQHLSICGEVPTAIGMVALRELGVRSFDFIDRTTSYEESGNEDWVVGYPAGVIYR